jgi:hypothetical protein
MHRSNAKDRAIQPRHQLCHRLMWRLSQYVKKASLMPHRKSRVVNLGMSMGRSQSRAKFARADLSKSVCAVGGFVVAAHSCVKT